MPIGPGVYDSLCTAAREGAKAKGVVLIVVEGEHGSGFCVQGPLEVHESLPDRLEVVAQEIRSNADKLTQGAGVAMLMLTLGRTLGMLNTDDVRAGLIEALQGRSFPAAYLTRLRDDLDAVLKDSGHNEGAANGRDRTIN
jgi:hypothetical protein